MALPVYSPDTNHKLRPKIHLVRSSQYVLMKNLNCNISEIMFGNNYKALPNLHIIYAFFLIFNLNTVLTRVEIFTKFVGQNNQYDVWTLLWSFLFRQTSRQIVAIIFKLICSSERTTLRNCWKHPSCGFIIYLTFWLHTKLIKQAKSAHSPSLPNFFKKS